MRLTCSPDQEEEGELDSHKDVTLSFSGPGDIKMREVVLDPQFSPEEIKSMEVEVGSEYWISFAPVVPQQQCYGHFPCDSAPHSSGNSNCVVHLLLHNGKGTLP